MHAWQALVLGLVEGLTEYLPVSSTGHLLVTQRLLGIEASEAANAFAVFIQGGAILAVLVLYWRRIVSMLLGVIGRDPAGLRLALAVAVAFLPFAIAGFLFDDLIEGYLFGALPVAVAWAVGGLVILYVSPRLAPGGAALDHVPLRAALVIGLCQCAALWPGVSRSFATILGAIAAGLSLAAAVEFSFLLGLLTLGVATAYKLLDGGEAMVQAYGVSAMALGFLAAWVSAMLSVVWMVNWLQRRPLAVFGWWRIAAAAVVVALVATGRL
ncbi:undecaprenyl-diphosphatase 2 [Luteitalea sp. TBR-22]|uniref:undecaprenyl-diphosphate phosphatase n=1 Tax=Luteitalea sp. TBR-22 TaxID=2802971 RepID=UPI001AFA5B4D|nr:undecaprenyl-diphosphate phosphatase [Luteitalea sp. TBR-22]BCS32501.1 undecaprenyl-diphosphatase 2 [Luteitalea sp. TBR-22]